MVIIQNLSAIYKLNFGRLPRYNKKNAIIRNCAKGWFIMNITKEQGNFVSSARGREIVYTRWVGNGKPPAFILLIAHGMAEYVGRYDAFARFMAQNGGAVYGNDHLGHGATAGNPDLAGHLEKGWRRDMVEDMRALGRLARREFPGLPVILLGHSMGSFVARVFCGRYPDEIDGAIIMGTGGSNPASGAGIALVNLLSIFKGGRHRSALIDRIAFGGYNRTFAGPKTKFDWLNTDEAGVQAYLDDPYCGYLMTLSGYRELFKLLNEATQKRWVRGIRADLPILIVSGADDPVGNFGVGVRQTFEDLHGAGMTHLTIILYDGMRHEILNEPDRQMVYDDILKWCREAI